MAYLGFIPTSLYFHAVFEKKLFEKLVGAPFKISPPPAVWELLDPSLITHQRSLNYYILVYELQRYFDASQLQNNCIFFPFCVIRQHYFNLTKTESLENRCSNCKAKQVEVYTFQIKLFYLRAITFKNYSATNWKPINDINNYNRRAFSRRPTSPLADRCNGQTDTTEIIT